MWYIFSSALIVNVLLEENCFLISLKEMNMKEPNISIYTDGGCLGNPGVGAWAYVLVDKDIFASDSGYEERTTNNRMELSAVIEALRHCEKHYATAHLLLFSDSQYVVRGAVEWLPAWKKKQWKGSNRKIIQNVEFWKSLDALAQLLTIEWKWVPGHADVRYNEFCHEMVHSTIKRAQSLR